MKSTTMKSTCLAPNCDKVPLTRGLCCGHYSYLTKLIAKNKAPSFEELERRGKVLPCKKRGRRESSFQNWLNGE